jgi:hypothetical protein
LADQNQQNQAAQNAEAQRRADEQRRAQQQGQGQQGGQQGQQRAGQPQGGQQDAFQRGAAVGQEMARARYEDEKRLTAERPQQSGNEGSQPTPTQQENDEIRAGLRHIDDKEDDRSGADPKFAMRRIDADETRGKYETR